MSLGGWIYGEFSPGSGGVCDPAACSGVETKAKDEDTETKINDMSLFNTLTYTGTLVVETCCECKMKFALDREFYNERRNDHKLFFCPAGHQQFYSGKSDKEKLEQEVKALKERESYLEEAKARLHNQLASSKHRERAQKAAKTRLFNRVKNGVCPCCNRTFSNLAEHMKTKHPETCQKTHF